MMIKKRSIKSANLRKSSTHEDEENEDSGEGEGKVAVGDETSSGDLSVIALVKAEQEMRRLKNGLTVDSNGTTKTDVKNLSTSKGDAPISIGSMISNQFASSGDSSNSTMGHEKILEAYVNERLGIKTEPKE
jgi:hypothetical protein